MKTNKFPLVIAILSYLFIAKAVAQDFNKIDINFPKLINGVIEWADYDNDGDLDFIVTGADEGIFHADIYKNEGNNVFRNINAGIQGGTTGSVAWGDYNNDGFLDLLITGFYYINGDILYTKLYRNDRNDKFTEVNTNFLPLAYCKTGAHFGYYDKDDKLDVLLAGIAPGSQIKIYKNEGDGKFSDVALSGILPAMGSIDWGDYDNDGDLDILSVGLRAGKESSIIYRNEGNNRFVDINAGLVDVGYNSACRFIDYDNDGDLDVIISGVHSSLDERGNSVLTAVTIIYKNEGNGQFKDIDANLTGLEFGSIDWGDYNKDGKLDLLLTGSSLTYTRGDHGYDYVDHPVTKIYANMGNDKFIDVSGALQNISHGDGRWGDYDNDGDPDIIITGDHNLILYNNQLITTHVNEVNKPTGKDIILFTNPSNNFLYLKSTRDFYKISLLRIINQRGQVVYSGMIDLNRDSIEKIDLPGMAGVFIIEIINGSFYFSDKILIE